MQKKAGESFTLEVSLVAAIDIAKMIWLKDRNVVPHDRYSLEVAGAKYTSRLRFDKVNIDDAGEYGVTVEYTQLSGPTKYADLTILCKRFFLFFFSMTTTSDLILAPAYKF